MRILVIGGTGNVGRPLVAQLRARGIDVVAASRRATPAAADEIALDMTDPAALEAAARGFDAAYLATPLGPDETEIGLAALAALGRANVKKIVYLAIHNLEEMQDIPHFKTKIAIKKAVLGNPQNVVLQPNFFYQNDLMAMPAITGPGIYPLPIGTAGVWSIDAADIARAAVNALTSSDWDGRAVPLCGPEKLTGPLVAQNWSTVIDRSVTYGGNAIAPFIAAMRQNVPDLTNWIENDFTKMMEVTQERGCPATAEDRATSEAIVGQPLRTHHEFASTTIKENTQ